MKILIVEGDATLAEAFRFSLQRDHHVVECVDVGDDADRMLQREAYSLVLIDLATPGLDPCEVIRRMRRRSGRAAVLAVAASTSSEARARATRAGADDFLVKPFNVDELEQRVGRLLSRDAAGSTELKAFGRLLFDPREQTASIGDVPLDLSRREASVLGALLRNFGRLTRKERLMGQVFGISGEVGPNTLEVYIHRLRKKLPGSGLFLKTVHGQGYVLEDEPSG